MESGKSSFLQLDLKPYAPLSIDVLKNLLSMIAPIKDRIMVSCVADWAIRLLRKMDFALMLGFDPLLYLDIVGTEPRPEGIPPFRLGAFGYLDDHPLAAQKWGKPGEYFALRAEALLFQVPKGTTWFINADLLIAALDAGFNWVETIKINSSKVDAWTIDLDRKKMAEKLIAKDIDFITSNDAVLLQKDLLR
jgi:glycerophosphoryl diester phosphodiesterase